jgi:hypothetical protein
MQATAMSAAIKAVVAARSAFNITDYRWFDLRDADSSGAGFEHCYGLLSDTYVPKPAFAVYRQLVARYG